MNLRMIVLTAAVLALPTAAQAGDKADKPAPAIGAPAPGMGQVVVWRPSKFVGSAIRCTVREDGKMVGRAGNGRYFVLSAAPGAHRYTTKTEATDTLNIEVEPDETTYVKCTIGMGLVAGRPNLSPSTPEEFAQAGSKLKLQDPEEMAKDIAEDEAERAAKVSAGN